MKGKEIGIVIGSSATILALLYLLFSPKKLTAAPVAKKSDSPNRKLVDPSLQKYFDAFQAEGQKRGLKFDVYDRGIKAEFADYIGQDVAGLCTVDSGAQHRYTLQINPVLWATFDEYMREMVVFHELGHCYFDFQHDDRAANGVCLEVMNSGTIGCDFLYNEETRNTRLDTFFDDAQKSYLKFQNWFR